MTKAAKPNKRFQQSRRLAAPRLSARWYKNRVQHGYRKAQAALRRAPGIAGEKTAELVQNLRDVANKEAVEGVSLGDSDLRERVNEELTAELIALPRSFLASCGIAPLGFC